MSAPAPERKEEILPAAISYLSEPETLPRDRLELFFLLKSGLKHVATTGFYVLTSPKNVAEGSLRLAECCRRLANVAQALADVAPRKGTLAEETKWLNRTQI
jgi:hypothetical protein